MLFRIFLLCASASFFCTPLVAEEEEVLASAEIDFPMDYEDEDPEDDDLSFEELIAMEDDVFDEMFFTDEDEDEDEFEAIIASDEFDLDEDFSGELSPKKSYS